MRNQGFILFCLVEDICLFFGWLLWLDVLLQNSVILFWISLFWTDCGYVIDMDHCYIGHTLFALEVVSDDASGELLLVESPSYQLKVVIDIHLDQDQLIVWQRTENFPPFSRLLLDVSIRIVNITISYVQSDGFVAYLVLYAMIVFGHYPNLYAVELGMKKFEGDGILAVIGQHLFTLQAMPQLISTDLFNLMLAHLEML